MDGMYAATAQRNPGPIAARTAPYGRTDGYAEGCVQNPNLSCKFRAASRKHVTVVCVDENVERDDDV